VSNLKLWFWLVVAVFVVAVVASIPSFFTFKAQKEAKIAELNAELAQLTAQKSEVERHAGEIDAQNAAFRAQIGDLQGQVQMHLDKVMELQAQLAVARVNTFATADPSEYAAKINQAFPEMAKSGWSIIETSSASGRTRLWVRFPLGMVDSFINAQEEARSSGAQANELKSAVQLQNDMIGLHERINQLSEEKAEMYMQAYNDALAAYTSANKDFVELLKQPNFKVDVPKRGALIGCTLLGVLLGTAL
jgi:uncharacterized protein HemX